MPIDWLKPIFRILLGWLYRVELHGMHHYREAGDRVLMIANHTSFLDGIMLTLFLPDRLGFVVNTHIARLWWVKPFLYFIDVFLLDHTRPFVLRSLIRYVQEGGRAVIFPEGRITLTGSLMKVYPGSGMTADRSGAVILPIRIDGLQYTPLSRLGGRVRLRWFPRVRLTILPPQQLSLENGARGRARRTQATRRIADLMSEMVFATGLQDQTLLHSLHEAFEVYGGDKIIVDDIDRRALSYSQVLGLAREFLRRWPAFTRGQRVGLMFPVCPAVAPVFLACLDARVVPVMLSPQWPRSRVREVCEQAGISTLFYSGRMMVQLHQENLLRDLGEMQEGGVPALIEVDSLLDPMLGKPPRYHRASRRTHSEVQDPDAVAVVLPRFGHDGLKLREFSHRNLLAARQQLVTRFDFGGQDVIFSVWPLHEYLGLMLGLILPLLSGMRTYLYPMVGRQRIASELIYDMGATLVTGPMATLAGYARVAHAYDFYNVRYALVFEPLDEQVRRLFWNKLGVRLFEGCCDPQSGVMLSLNTPMEHRAGSSGRILPGMQIRLLPRGSDRGTLQARCATLPKPCGETILEHDPWCDTGLEVRLDERNFVFQSGSDPSGSGGS